MAVKLRKKAVLRRKIGNTLPSERRDGRRDSTRGIHNPPLSSKAAAHEEDEDDVRVSLKREREPRFAWDEVRRENGL
jgi:hypothetical protein